MWKFCPSVVEPNGKLKDKVRVEGRIEEHTEGTYYIEWRSMEHGLRRRAPVRERGQVLEQARIESSGNGCKHGGVDREVIVPMTDLGSTQAPPALVPYFVSTSTGDHLLRHNQFIDKLFDLAD